MYEKDIVVWLEYDLYCLEIELFRGVGVWKVMWEYL